MKRILLTFAFLVIATTANAKVSWHQVMMLNSSTIADWPKDIEPDEDSRDFRSTTAPEGLPANGEWQCWDGVTEYWTWLDNGVRRYSPSSGRRKFR